MVWKSWKKSLPPRSQLYRFTGYGQRRSSGDETPSRNYEEDVSYIDRFIQEEWIGKRINSPYVVKNRHSVAAALFLYYLMKPVSGIFTRAVDETIRYLNPQGTEAGSADCTGLQGSASLRHHSSGSKAGQYHGVSR